MARTTANAVQAVIETEASISLTPFIDIANALVTKHCEELNSSYTVTELEMIERFLAAHVYTLRDPRVADETFGTGRGVSSKYQSKVDLGFSTSHYGQMAMLLDWYGGLAALNEKMKKGGRTPAISWMGEESEELEE